MDTAKKSARKKTVSGADDWDRTNSLCSTDALFYQLNYVSIPGPQGAGKHKRSTPGHAKTRGWSWWTDLNPRPADYKSAALPTELHQHVAHKGRDWSRMHDTDVT